MHLLEMKMSMRAQPYGIPTRRPIPMGTQGLGSAAESSWPLGCAEDGPMGSCWTVIVNDYPRDGQGENHSDTERNERHGGRGGTYGPKGVMTRRYGGSNDNGR